MPLFIKADHYDGGNLSSCATTFSRDTTHFNIWRASDPREILLLPIVSLDNYLLHQITNESHEKQKKTTLGLIRYYRWQMDDNNERGSSRLLVSAALHSRRCFETLDGNARREREKNGGRNFHFLFFILSSFEHTQLSVDTFTLLCAEQA